MAAAGINPPDDNALWNEDREVRKFYQNIVKDRVSGSTGFKAFEKVTNFYLVPKEFEKNKEMTESLKIKRNAVFEIYAEEIKAMYKE